MGGMPGKEIGVGAGDGAGVNLCRSFPASNTSWAFFFSNARRSLTEGLSFRGAVRFSAAAMSEGRPPVRVDGVRLGCRDIDRWRDTEGAGDSDVREKGRLEGGGRIIDAEAGEDEGARDEI